MHLIYFLTLVCLIPLAMLSAETVRPEVIIFLGPPASGKGTQASRLARELKLPHISTGDLFRDNIRQNTELGKKAKTFMDAGKLVPDELVLDMFYDRVAKADAEKGYVLDGFPRTIPQAEALSKHLGPKIDLKVINLVVSDETLIKRASGRRFCANCKEGFNIYFNPPSEEGKCKCKGPLIQRDDDKPEVVKERLRVYKAQTEPLIQFYEKNKVLHNIDGEKGPDQVYYQIKELVIK
jgi:adenylate kinase